MSQNRGAPRYWLGIAAGLLAGMTLPATAADVTFDRLINADKEVDNWIHLHKNYSGHRFAQQTQINKTNVKNLRLVSTYMLAGVTGGGRYEYGQLEGTPLVEDGFMYISDGWGAIYKVDVRDGAKPKPVWVFDPAIDRAWAADVACCGVNNRGVALWKDQVISVALDGRLFAINKETGKVTWERKIADPAMAETITVAPLVVKDIAVIGIAGSEYGVRGFLDATDLKTGKQAWKFWTIPGKGEPGNETWGDNHNAWETGGGSIWQTGTYDPATNTMFWGTGNPAPQFDSEFRPGDNLYTESMIALDADTGKLKFFFQYTPNDPYDYDEIAEHPLIDVEINGEMRKVVAHAARNGFVYAMDRTNGQFLYGQPYVTVINWTPGIDPKTGKPLNYVARQDIAQPYAPGTPGRRGGPPGVFCPALPGGKNWGPTAYNPNAKFLYVPSNEGCTAYIAVEQSTFTDKGGTRKRRERFDGRANAPADTKMPLMQVKASLSAIDMRTGKIVKKNNMTFRHDGGVLATAGGLVFGGNVAGEFTAYDDTTLDILYTFNAGTGFKAPPITYAVNGKQYIAILAGTKPTPRDIGFQPELKYFSPSNMLYIFAL